MITPSAPPLYQQEMEHLYTSSNYPNLYPPLESTDIEHTGIDHAVIMDKNHLDNQTQSTAAVSPAKGVSEEHKIVNQPDDENGEENEQTKEYINTDWDEDMGSRAQLEAAQTKEYINTDWDEDMGSRTQLAATQTTNCALSSHDDNGKMTEHGQEREVPPDNEKIIDTIPPKLIHVEPVNNSAFKTDAETNPI